MIGVDLEQFRVAVEFYAQHGWAADGARLLAVIDAHAAPSRRADAFTCTHPGCIQTDGKPCAYAECPNREARS